jgi:hypothetical protein
MQGVAGLCLCGVWTCCAVLRRCSVVLGDADAVGRVAVPARCGCLRCLGEAPMCQADA